MYSNSGTNAHIITYSGFHFTNNTAKRFLGTVLVARNESSEKCADRRHATLVFTSLYISPGPAGSPRGDDGSEIIRDNPRGSSMVRTAAC